MKDKNFVITSLQVWDIEIGSTIKNTALELSKQNRVLYVNTPMDHATWIRKSTKKSYTHRMDVINKKEPCLRKINDNLWVLDCPFMVYSINKIGWPKLFNCFNKANNRKIARFISKMVKELGFDNFIHLIDTDIYRSFYLKEMIKPHLSIYYRRDYIIGESYWKKHGTRLEPLLCTKSDIVLANSLYFANELKKYNPNTMDIETGVNLELYDNKKNFPVPQDMTSITHPIIGYIGTINSNRLDSELLLEIAISRPNYSFVFTGPQDDYFKVHALHSLPNVYFMGNKSIDQLPAYICSYDVCINPQMVNDMTIGNYPLKIDEYLALGKPIVATTTHTMEHIFADYLYLAQGVDQYVEKIDLALCDLGDQYKRDRRIAFAHTHSWQNSVQKIYHAIESFENNEK